MRKKLLSVCFILAAVLSLMTVTALAVPVNDAEELQAALDRADDNEVIDLGQTISTEGLDIEVKDNLVERTITINLEGTDYPCELVLGKGSIVVGKNNNLIIKGGKIGGSGDQVVQVKDGALDVRGTTVINDGSGIGVSITQTGGKLTMTDGIIQAKNGCAVYQSALGTRTEIKGGTVTGAVGIVADAGRIIVGTENPSIPQTAPPTIEATGSGTRKIGNNSQIRAAGIAFAQNYYTYLTIYNGQVLSKNAEAIYSINTGSDTEIDIMGGTFSSDVSGSGFVPDAVAMVSHKDDGDTAYTYYTYYTTLQDAITKAQPGDTVRLLKDVGATDSSVDISIDKAITLNLDGKTINGRLTINDGNNNVTINGGTITGGTSTAPAVRVNSGTVTISNTTITGTATGVSVTGGAVTGGAVIINASKIEGTNGISVTDGGSLTIDGNTTTTTITGTTGDGIIVAGTTTSVTINGGAIKGATNGIEVKNGGSLTVGGTAANPKITGATGDGIIVDGTTTSATITNGTIEGTTSGITITGGEADITGGEIKGATKGIEVNDSGALNIVGGTITGTTNGIEVKNGGSLTVEGAAANPKITGTTGVGIIVDGTATSAKITGGTITGAANGISVTSGKLTVENAAVVATGAAGVGIAVEGDDSELTVESGTINASTGIQFNGNKLTFNSGTINNASTGIQFSGIELTITGGTIMGNSEDGVKISSGAAIISGGKITGMNGNGISLTGGSLTVEGTLIDTVITGRTGAGIAVSGSGTLTVTGGTIEGTGTGAYGISVQYGSNTEVTIVKVGEENAANDTISISGATALYIFEDPAASPVIPDIKVYSGIFKSTAVIGKAVESSINGFIYGGKFINSADQRDSLSPLYLAAERTQKSDGTVVPIAEGDKKVTFYLDGGEFEDGSDSYELIIAAGETFNKRDMPATDPIRDGYVFAGWFTENGEEPPYGRVISTNIKIYAHWDQLLTFIFDAGPDGDFRGEKDPYPYEHEITVERKESGIIQGQKLPKDKWPTIPIYNKGDEFVFGGWYTTAQPGGTKVDYDTPFENNEELDDLVSEDGRVTLYAHWGYEITFNLNYDGAPSLDSLVTEKTVDEKHILVKWPTPPEQRTASYKFDGWFIGDECSGKKDEETETPEDYEFEAHIAVHAHWTPKVDVELTAELKDQAGNEIKVLTSEEVEPEIILTVKGAKFADADDLDVSYFILSMGGEPVDEELVFVKEVKPYTDPDGKTEENTKIIITLNAAPKDAGMLTIEVNGDAFQSPPTKDTTIDVRVAYEVIFDLNVDEELPEDKKAANTDINNELTSLPTPTRTGEYDYDFVGWFIGSASEHKTDGTCTTKVTIGEGATVFEENTNVHAHWNQTSFTVTFHSNRFEGDDEIRTVITDPDGLLTPEDLAIEPTYADYTFDGWYTDPKGGELVTIDTKFDEDNHDVYAHWIKNSCDITFDAGDGTFENGSTTQVETIPGNTKFSELPAAPANPPEGYTFAGWFIGDEDGGCKEKNSADTEEDSKCKEVTTDTVFKDNTRVHAHWGFEITFNLNYEDAPSIDGLFVTEVDGQLTKWPDDPTRDGYVFTGWYTASANGRQVNVDGYKFERATTVYAQWSQSVALTVAPAEMFLGDTAKEITLKITTDDVTFVSGADKDLFTLSGAAAEGLSVEDAVRSTDGKEVKITLNKAPDIVGTLTITVDGSALSPRRAQNASVDVAVRLPVYTITFDPNGGTLTGDTTAKTTDGKLTSLPTPTRDGYTFVGWFKALDGEDEVTTDTVFEANTIIYAHWTKETEDPGPGEPSKPDDPGTPDDDDRVYYIQIASGSLHGRVYTDAMSAKKGTTVWLTVTPDSDYTVYSVKVTRDDTGASVPTSGSYAFTMPDSDVTVSAEFSLRPEYNNFVPPQTQSQYQNQNQNQNQTGAPATLPTSVFKPVTWRPAAAMRDVPTTSWAYPAAQWAYQNGYLDTAADGTFQLNDTVSHMQLWRIMARWQGEAALDDNSVTQWARRTGASRIGTASGAMTRQNMVEYLYQCYFLLGGNVSVSGNLVQYRDSQMIVSASAKNAWIWAVNKGIISGTPDGALNPNGILSRGEFASILMRLCQKG